MSATIDLPQLKPSPAKSDELEWLANIIGNLPDGSYLRDILRELRPQIERAIRNDLCLLDVDLREREALYLQFCREISKRCEERDELTATIASYTRTRDQLAGQLRDSADQLETLANRMRKLAK